jgi:hypothetical protein
MTKQDIDLQKIQVLESSYQGWFTVNASFATGAYVALAVLFVTLKIENLIDLNWFMFLYFLAFIYGILSAVYLQRRHNRHMDFMSNLLAKIEKGEKLGSIKELRQKHKDNTKK